MSKKNYKQLKDGSRHVFNYLKKGSNHCAWDYDFLVGLVHAKLEDMYEFFSNDERTHLLNSERVAHEIFLVKRLFEVVMDEDCEGKTPNPKTLSKHLLRRYNYAMDEKNGPFIRKSVLESLYKQKAMELAFRLMGEYIEDWWD